MADTETREKSEFETAIEAFDAADTLYKRYEQMLTTGTIMSAMMADRKEPLTPDRAVLEFTLFMDRLKNLLEDRNAKLKNAKDALRQAVVLAPTQWRGVEGRPTVLSHGDFKVNSVTSRTFNASDLIRLLDPASLKDLLMREKLDKNGVKYKIVRQTYEVDYEAVLSFLKAYHLTDVIDGSYDETEKTPMVSGPKTLAFLGDEAK